MLATQEEEEEEEEITKTNIFQKFNMATSTNLNIVKLPYLSEISADLDEI